MGKRSMEKLIVCLCAGAVAVSMAACGNGGRTENDSMAESRTEESSGPGDRDQSSAEAGAGHNYEEGWTEEMERVKSAILNTVGDNYFPNMALMPDMLEEQFGITADMYDDYLAEMPLISANVDTLLIIRAKDGKVKEVEDALDVYRDARINDSLQYPMNVGVVQASRIERIGNYVCFAQLGGDVMEAMENGDEAVILQCQGLNELVIEIISQNIRHE